MQTPITSILTDRSALVNGSASRSLNLFLMLFGVNFDDGPYHC